MTNIIDIIRGATTNAATPWVLYKQGTIVFLPDGSGDLAAQACELLSREGPVIAGTPAGDFSVTTVEHGWFVRSHHPDIMTVVAARDMDGDASDFQVGLAGRSNRDRDARELEVAHIHVGTQASSPNTMSYRQQRLEAGDALPMVEYLMGSDASVTIEETEAGLTVYPETRSALHLGPPWSRMFLEALSRLPELVVRFSERGLEVRRRGALYYLRNQLLEDSTAQMLVTGIEHTGRMSGGTAQAILRAFGPETEAGARELLAETDRSLGTVVAQPLGESRWIAYVVSTPKHTPRSPGWLETAVENLLDKALELGVRKLATTALGTNGGIEPKVAARLMLSTAQRWFQDNPVPMHFTICLPHGPTRQAFQEEFRRQRVFFSDKPQV